MNDVKTSEDRNRDVLHTDNNGKQETYNCFHTVLELALKAAQYSKVELTDLPPVLIDADILLDVLLGRQSKFFKDMKKVLSLVFSRKVNAYISVSGLQRVWTFSKDLKDRKTANYLLFNLVRYFNVCTSDTESLKRGCQYSSSRVSVGIQIERAKKLGASLIISSSDFEEFAKCGYAKTFSPSGFLQKWFYDHSGNDAISPKDSLSTLTIDKKWKIEDFNLFSSKKSSVIACVTLLSTTDSNKRVFGSSASASSVESIINAFDEAVLEASGQLDYERVSIQVVDVEERAESSVIASAIVRAGTVKVQKYHSSPDSVQACFYAYAKAVSEIIGFIKEDRTPALEESIEMHGARFQISQDIREQYKENKVRDFSNRILRDSNFDGCDFSDDASFRGCDFSLSYMRHINLEGANLEGAVLKEAYLSYANLANANLERASLIGAKINRANLKDANLSKAVLSKCCLEGTSLDYANLSRANLDQAVAHGALLANVNLSQASLQYIDLSNASLKGANLTNADLTSAKLSKTDLTNANLAGAILENIDFSSATMDGANLSGANLKNANLSNVDIKKLVFCKPSLLNTAMPQVKFEVYGSTRSEEVVNLLSQIQSDHYQIYAVHSDPSGTWWDSPIGEKLLSVNSAISSIGVDIKRLFIISEKYSTDKTQSILYEHEKAGVVVKMMSESLADSLGIHSCRERNFLICKNKHVHANSFVTMMIADNDDGESGGYISYRDNDLKKYEKTFDILWKEACLFSSEQETNLIQCFT